MPARPSLTRADWIAGALALCGEAGFAKVAVEPLATRLGATKGSFYWHFDSRDELLAAMLSEWESGHTAEMITATDSHDPASRLNQIVKSAFRLGSRGAEGRVERAILQADHPLARPVVERVHRARIDYLARLFTDVGLATDRARARARITYSAYLGHLQLMPDGEPDPAAASALLDELTRMVAVP